MSDPVRLYESSDSSLERQLLGVARAEKSSPEMRARTLAALGITGTAALSATAVSAAAARASVAAGKTVWAKLLIGLSAAGAIATAPPVYRAWQRHQALGAHATAARSGDARRRRPPDPRSTSKARRHLPSGRRGDTGARAGGARCRAHRGRSPAAATRDRVARRVHAHLPRRHAGPRGGDPAHRCAGAGRTGCDRAPPRGGVRSPLPEQRPRGAGAPVPRRLRSARCARAAKTRTATLARVWATFARAPF